MDEGSYKDDLKYRSISTMLRNSMSLKTKEAILWRRTARRYLRNFPLQWENRKLPTWTMDNEIFDDLQRQAQSLMIEFG